MTTSISNDAPFDPATVPVFPVLTMELTADGGARLNGRALPVGADQDPTDVALAAAADEARLLPGDYGAIRVRGVAADGTVFPLVVCADGTVHELPTAPDRTPRPDWMLPAIAAAAAIVLAGTTLGVVTALRPGPAPVPAVTAPTPLPGAGANLPISAPPGFAQRATWSVPITEQIAPVATSTGDLAAVSEDGDLVVLDDLTGHTLWTGHDAPRSGELHVLRNQGTDVIATASTEALHLWPIGDPAHGPEPVSIDLPRGAEVSFAGSTPLVTLPDQTAGLIVHGELTLVDVPVGATAVAADSDSITAVDLTGTRYDLAPGAEPVAYPLPRPAGTEGRAVRAIGAGDRNLVVVWSVGEDQVVTLHDLSTGTEVAHASAGPVDLTRAGVLQDPVSARMTVGPVLVTYSTPAVLPLSAGFDPEVLTAGHIYGDLDGQRVDAVIDGNRVTVRAAPDAAGSGTPEAFPVVVSSTHAYVPARKLEQWLLHAVPTTGATP
jgi:hypothetical protein